jgi:translocation and assembly module TamB
MSRSRLKYALKWLTAGLSLVLVLLLAGAYWLFASSAGSVWLWSQLEQVAGGQLKAERVQGDLANGFIVRGLVYRSPQQEIQVRQIELQAVPGFWPLSVSVEQLIVADVVIRPGAVQTVQSEPEAVDVRGALEAMKLPLPVHFERIELAGLRVEGDQGAQVFALDSVLAKLSLGEILSVETFLLQSQEIELNAHASLALQRPFEFELGINTVIDTAQAFGGDSSLVPLQLEGKGNLESLDLHLQSEQIGLVIEAGIQSPLEQLLWDVSGQLKSLPAGLELSRAGLAIDDLRFSSLGDLDDWSIKADSAVTLGGQAEYKLGLEAIYADDAIDIEQLFIRGQGINASSSGTFMPGHDGGLALKTRITQLDPSPWVSQWPQGEFLIAELNMEYSAQHLLIPDARIKVNGSGAEARIRADVDLVKEQIDATVKWHDLSWPVNVPAPRFTSPTGQLEILGQLAQWQAIADVELVLGDYPKTRMQLQGAGDRSSAHLVLQDSQLLGGRMSGEADIDWLTRPAGSIRLNAQGIDPGALLEEWPGRLDAELRISGNVEEGIVAADLEIENLEGVLRDQRVQANGGISLAEERLEFRRLDIGLNDARLQLEGATTDAAGAAFSFNGPLPGILLNGVNGYAQLDGRFSNHQGKPLIELSMQALDLTWDDISIKALAIQVGEQQGGTPLPSIDVNATRLQWQERVFDEVSLSLQPEGKAHRLTASVASEMVDFTGRAKVQAGAPEASLTGPWSGELEILELIVADSFGFELEEPAAFTWMDASFALPGACFQGTRGEGICTGVSYQANSDLSVNATLNAIPLSYLPEILQLDVGFEQLLSGRVDWRMSAGSAPLGSVDLRVSPGQIVDLIDNEPFMESREGSFGFQMRDGNLEAGVLDIEFPGVGFIDVDFEVQDFALRGQQQLRGVIASQLNDIEIFGQLALPMLDQTGGRFESNIRIGGTLSDPQLDGRFSLTEGVFYYAPTGLRLVDVNLAGKLESRDQGTLDGQFRLGDGIARLDGRFSYENAGQAKLHLDVTGEDLLMINTTNLKMLADMNLNIGLAPGRLDINGNVEVPSAQLTSSNLVINTVTDSEDLVVVNRVQQQEEATARQEKTQVFGQLVVAFGDAVNVKIPGVETSITGSVSYNWSGEPVPLANGNYYLNGVVDVYGPRLEFISSSIAFPGVPANNPLLNIRAQREIFGNTQIRSAGVQLTGTLKRPLLEAFTVPVTNEDRAWTLLVTGSDFDQGQGVGGFDVGTYILPRLYISYGISLFEDDNVISARYDLKRGFGVKVTSGQRETGLDISYTIDK